MIRLNSNLNAQGQIPLGKVCEFTLAKRKPDIESRCYLMHHDLFYLKPILDWNQSDHVSLFLEAPGKYTLLVEWREPGGKSGWVELPITVLANVKTLYIPQMVQVDSKTQIWAPSEWEAQRMENYERTAFDLLPKIVQPGWVIYDVGANLGMYALQFSRLVGPQGRVYGIEANPVCVYFLRTNLALNNISNCIILPVAISDSASQINFNINYSNSALGLIQSSPFYATKPGHEILVHGDSLDTMISELNLRKPNLIKIDIEGAEGFALRGMLRTITESRPVLIIEVHGKQAAEMTFRQLEPMRYDFLEIASNTKFANVNELLNWFPDAVLQFICKPL